jgi:hypothetical protein
LNIEDEVPHPSLSDKRSDGSPTSYD